MILAGWRINLMNIETKIESMIPFMDNLRTTVLKYPTYNFSDAFSTGQVKSKLWLIDELSKVKQDLGITFILGGWYGTLAALMFESNKFNNLIIRSFDKDETCADVADLMNKKPYVVDGWQFKASTADMYKIDYNHTVYNTKKFNGDLVELSDIPETIINTSCEHLEKFSTWWDLIPSGKLVVLQSNNFFDALDHCNCVNNLNEFKKQTTMKEIFYEGVLQLEKYNRFMLIGIK